MSIERLMASDGLLGHTIAMEFLCWAAYDTPNKHLLHSPLQAAAYSLHIKLMIHPSRLCPALFKQVLLQTAEILWQQESSAENA